jgi:hypothetical protein
MTADQLEAEFASRAVRPFTAPGILMLEPAVALELIGRARAAGLPVLGVDGFFLDGPRTVSPLEHLADFSSAVRRGDGAWDAATSFIRARRELGLVFEVVLGDPLAHAG